MASLAGLLDRIGNRAMVALIRSGAIQRAPSPGQAAEINPPRPVTPSAANVPEPSIDVFRPAPDVHTIGSNLNVGTTELLEQIDVGQEWLDRQTTSSFESVRVQGALRKMRAEVQRRAGAIDRPPTARRERGAAAPAPSPRPPEMEMPRTLRERGSVRYQSVREVRGEIDRIIAWLGRGGVSKSDRQVLELELSNLSPQFEQDRALRAASRRGAVIEAALAPSPAIANEDEQTLDTMRRIDSIRDLADGGGYIMRGTERIVLTEEEVWALRGNVTRDLEKIEARTRSINKAIFNRMLEWRQLNEDHAYLAAIAGQFVEHPFDRADRVQREIQISNTVVNSPHPTFEAQARHALFGLYHAYRARDLLNEGREQATAAVKAYGKQLIVSAASLVAPGVLSLVGRGAGLVGLTGVPRLAFAGAGTTGIMAAGGAGVGAFFGDARGGAKEGAILGFTAFAGSELGSLLRVGKPGVSAVGNWVRSQAVGAASGMLYTGLEGGSGKDVLHSGAVGALFSAFVHGPVLLKGQPGATALMPRPTTASRGAPAEPQAGADIDVRVLNMDPQTEELTLMIRSGKDHVVMRINRAGDGEMIHVQTGRVAAIRGGAVVPSTTKVLGPGAAPTVGAEPAVDETAATADAGQAHAGSTPKQLQAPPIQPRAVAEALRNLGFADGEIRGFSGPGATRLGKSAANLLLRLGERYTVTELKVLNRYLRRAGVGLTGDFVDALLANVPRGGMARFVGSLEVAELRGGKTGLAVDPESDVQQVENAPARRTRAPQTAAGAPPVASPQTAGVRPTSATPSWKIAEDAAEKAVKTMTGISPDTQQTTTLAPGERLGSTRPDLTIPGEIYEVKRLGLKEMGIGPNGEDVGRASKRTGEALKRAREQLAIRKQLLPGKIQNIIFNVTGQASDAVAVGQRLRAMLEAEPVYVTEYVQQGGTRKVVAHRQVAYDRVFVQVGNDLIPVEDLPTTK